MPGTRDHRTGAQRRGEAHGQKTARARGRGADLDLVPCAAAVWNPDRTSCELNARAREMTGLSAGGIAEGQQAREWEERIHRRDREAVRAAWERLVSGDGKRMACDYRFFPKGPCGEEVWLREVAARYGNGEGGGQAQTVVSMYLDITDLKAGGSESDGTGGREHTAEVMDGLVHEVQNSLQGISMGVDLVCLEPGERASLEARRVFQKVEQASRLLREAREYFYPASVCLSRGEVDAVVEEVILAMESEWRARGIRVRREATDPGDTVPTFEFDWRQTRRALERVLAFCAALMPDGGQLELRSGRQDMNGEKYAALEARISSATVLRVEEGKVFEPFLRVDSYQAGLSMMLVRRLFEAHRGKISFRKESPQRAAFNLLFPVE